ncbi:MAG TPA: hypothetical protein VMM37_03065, partial [Bacteroidota bacterium]|nr:hypothetical protein [Bacteroidota bacterium]
GEESGSYNQLAYIYAHLGRKKDSQKMLEANIKSTLQWLARGDEGPASRMDLAVSYRLQGNSADAYKWLRESVKAGWIDYRVVAINPLFDGFRSDAEFNQILGDIKAKVAAMRKHADGLDAD